MFAIRQCSITARQIAVRKMLQRPIGQLSYYNAENQNLKLISVQRENQQYRGYKNFSHKPEKMPIFTRIWYVFIGTSMVLCFIDWKR